MLTAAQWDGVIQQHCRQPRDISSRPLCQPPAFPGSGQHPKDSCGLIRGHLWGIPQNRGILCQKHSQPAPFCGLLCGAILWSMKTKMPGEWRLGQGLSDHREAWKRQPPLWYGFVGNYGFIPEESEIKKGCFLYAGHKMREPHTVHIHIVGFYFSAIWQTLDYNL